MTLFLLVVLFSTHTEAILPTGPVEKCLSDSAHDVVLVGGLVFSIKARIQAYLKTAQDPDGAVPSVS